MAFRNTVPPSTSLFYSDFASWKINLCNFIEYKDPNLWNWFNTIDRYEQPRLDGVLKSRAQMSVKERAEFDKDNRSYEMITKCLPEVVINEFKNQATSIGLWDALMEAYDHKEKKSEANIQPPSLNDTSRSTSNSAASTSTSTSNASYTSHTAPSKVTEDHATIFTAFLSSYENFLSKKASTLQLTEEDFEQIDSDDLEYMDIKWSMAMITQRTKKFLQRTGRKDMDDDGDTGLGFNKSKVKCKNCKIHGHFAKECEKEQYPSYGFTTPTAPKTPENNTTSPAMLAYPQGMFDSSAPQEKVQHSAFLAKIHEVATKPEEPLNCISCLELTESQKAYHNTISDLSKQVEKLTESNKFLKANEFLYEKHLEAHRFDTQKYKSKVFSQEDSIKSYLIEIELLTKELTDLKAEYENYKSKILGSNSSTVVFNEIISKQGTSGKKNAGMGYHSVPPPTTHYPLPVKEGFEEIPVDWSKLYGIKAKEAKNNKQAKEKTERSEYPLPKFVKPESASPVSVEEVVVVEDIPEESTIKVEKINVKPENFIITTENDDRFKCKGKTKVDNESSKVVVDKFEKNKPSTSTNSTSGTSTSTCSPKSACSTNVPAHRPSVYCPPPKRFEGTHWNQSFVERRSCFHCGQQGHIIRDCRLLSLDRFGRGMPRTSSFRNSFSKSFSRRGSCSPVSSCASNSPKPMARVNKVVPSRPQVQKHNIVENKSSEPKEVWKPKSTNNTSMKSSEFLKYHKLIDVMVMDDHGQPKSIKAWVSHKY